MATIVTFHAHPDDESIATGGTMARYASAGHRVVLVVATRGEHGEVQPGVLADGEALWERRVAETHRAAEALGVGRVEFLGYADSGMMGTPENDLPDAFWRADVEEAAERLARILRDESADVLTVYDENGAYGHPDHIQVHRVGVRAAELAATPRVYEATINRDHFRRLLTAPDAPTAADLPTEAELASLGVPEAEITTCLDVRAHLDAKIAAMRAHASQIAETSFFLNMPREHFEAAFGYEWYIRRGGSPGMEEDDLLTGLAP